MLSSLSIDVLNSLSLAELDALRFMDSNKEVVLALSIQKLSQRIFVSTATIMRLCKKLGFSGYSELKYFIRNTLSKDKHLNESVTFSGLKERYIESITDTSNNLDEELVLKIVDKMIESKRIHFFGKGLNSTILSYASKMLLTSGTQNYNYEDTHIAYLTAESMNEDDILFVSSLSGNTHQTVRMAQLAKSRNAVVIALTMNTQNELVKIADYSIGMHGDFNYVRPRDLSTRLPFLFVLDMIINVYNSKK